jgi:hypothetical protein
MPAGTNTKSNIGVSRMIYSLATPQMRNFEVNGTQTYKVVVGASVPYVYNGVLYATGAVIPYDSTVYSNAAQLERDFNAGLVDPSN